LNAGRVAVETYLYRSGVFKIKNQNSKLKNPFTLLARAEKVKLRPLPATRNRARDIQLPPPLKWISSSPPISETAQTIFRKDH